MSQKLFLAGKFWKKIFVTHTKQHFPRVHTAYSIVLRVYFASQYDDVQKIAGPHGRMHVQPDILT